MKPIVYEIKRTLTSKFVIIMIVAIVGLSTLIAYESGSSYSPVSIPTTPSVATGYYLNGSSVTMVSYVHDAYGNPSKDVTVSYSYAGVIHSSISTKNGYANATFSFPPGSTQLNVSVSYSYSQFRQAVSGNLPSMTINTHKSYSGLVKSSSVSGASAISPLDSYIFSRTNKTNLGLEFLYVGPNGSAAKSLTFYSGYTANYTSLTTNYVSKVTVSNVNAFSYFPSIPYKNMHNKTFYTEVTNGTGISVFISNPTSPSIFTVYSPISQSSLQSLVFSGTSTLLGFLIPLLAIFAGYLTYGKDRTSGVLESVLKRPVTRGSLITSRFASNAIAIFVAVGLSMVIADAIVKFYFGQYLSLSFGLYFVWTYLIEGVAFLALVYMFSQLVKSQGGILGIAIGLFVVLDLFWTIIPLAILAALGISTSSTAYIQTSVGFDYASPASYGTLVQAMFTGKFGTLSSTSINPNAFGIDGVNIIIAGILWVAIPFIAAFIMARKRD